MFTIFFYNGREWAPIINFFLVYTIPDPCEYHSISDPGKTIPDSRYTIPDHGYNIPDPEYTIPDHGYTIPDHGYTITDPVYAIPDPRYTIPDPRYTIPYMSHCDPRYGVYFFIFFGLKRIPIIIL